jgi:hypothetical protein
MCAGAASIAVVSLVQTAHASAQIQRVFALVELLRGVAAFLAAPLLAHLATTVAAAPAAGTRPRSGCAWDRRRRRAHRPATARAGTGAAATPPTSSAGSGARSRRGSRHRSWPRSGASEPRRESTLPPVLLCRRRQITPPRLPLGEVSMDRMLTSPTRPAGEPVCHVFQGDCATSKQGPRPTPGAGRAAQVDAPSRSQCSKRAPPTAHPMVSPPASSSSPDGLPPPATTARSMAARPRPSAAKISVIKT